LPPSLLLRCFINTAYTESQIKAFLSCSAFFHLNGSIHTYASSQEVLYKTLKDFYLKILKGEISNFDKNLTAIIKQNILLYYPNINSSDDIQYLINWTLSAVNDFFQIFPISKYTPLVTSHRPIVKYNSLSIKLDFDLLLVQNNQLAFIHAVSFYPKLDSHNSTSDFFNIIKLNFLNNVYAKRKYSQAPVRLHNISIKPASFRNKNTKNYPYTKYTIEKVSEKDKHQAKIALNYFIKNKDLKIIKPFCNIYDCSKRKECKNA